MKSEIEDPFKDLVEAECGTCSRYMLISPKQTYTSECQNCYITKLELLKLEEQQQQEAVDVMAKKVFKLRRG